MPDALHPLSTLAHRLGGVSERTARRALARAMEADSGLRVTRRGRTTLFTDAQLTRTLEALTWRCPSARRSAQ